MEKIKSHRDMNVWKESMEFLSCIYIKTKSFPDFEKFCLVNQMRRAAISICSNIAEGAARAHKKEFVQFLYISLGSASEIETQLEISVRLGYIQEINVEINSLHRIRKMLLGLIRSVQESDITRH